MHPNVCVFNYLIKSCNMYLAILMVLTYLLKYTSIPGLNIISLLLGKVA